MKQDALTILKQVARIEPPPLCHVNVSLCSEGFYCRVWWHPTGTLIYRSEQRVLAWEQVEELSGAIRDMLARVNRNEDARKVS